MQLCATLDPTTFDEPTEPPEQGHYTMQLCATLDRWAPFMKWPSTRTVQGLTKRSTPTSSDQSAKPSEQGSYTMQLCATLDR